MRILIIASLTFIISCKSNDGDIPIAQEQSVIASDYLPLDSGNYWVYQRVTIDPFTNEEILGSIDSIYYFGDTIINGLVYNILMGKKYGLNFRRLLNFRENEIINQDSVIYFSKNAGLLRSRLHNSVLIDSIQDFMFSEILQIETFAGLFESDKQYKQLHFAIEQEPNACDTLYENELYAKNVGIVQFSSYYFTSCTIVELRLIRYNVN